MTDYNGWTSNETWRVYSWLCENTSTFNWIRKIAKESQTALELTEEIEQMILEDHPLRREPSLEDEVLAVAISFADIQEIASFFLKMEHDSHQTSRLHPLAALPDSLETIDLGEGWKLDVVGWNHLSTSDVQQISHDTTRKAFYCSQYLVAKEGIESIKETCLDHINTKVD